MLRIGFTVLLSAAVLFAIYIMAPTHLKQKMIGSVSQLIPQTVKEKVEPFIYTPVERRQNLLDQLRSNVSEVKTYVAETLEENPKSEGVIADIAKIVDKIEESEQIINKIESINKDQSASGKVTTTIVERIVERVIPSKEPAQPAKESNSCPCNQ